MLNIDTGRMQELKFVDEEKDMRVTIDSRCKFLSHIVKQCPSKTLHRKSR